MCMEAITVARSDMLIIPVGCITVYMHAKTRVIPRPTTRPPRPELPVPGACPCSEPRSVRRGPAARRTRSFALQRSLSRPREEEAEEEELLKTSCCTGAARVGQAANGSPHPRAGTLCRLSRAMQVSNPYDHSA